MAKAKITKKGNVQVTMSGTQWQAVSDILMHVRLGNVNPKREALSNLLIDLEGFETQYGFREDLETADNVSISYETSKGNTKTISEDFAIDIH